MEDKLWANRVRASLKPSWTMLGCTLASAKIYGWGQNEQQLLPTLAKTKAEQ